MRCCNHVTQVMEKWWVSSMSCVWVICLGCAGKHVALSLPPKPHTQTYTHHTWGVEQQRLCFLTTHQHPTIGQLATAECDCCFDSSRICTYTHTSTRMHRHTNTSVKGKALIQFHFLLELSQMPLSVPCITFTFIIYTQRESQKGVGWGGGGWGVWGT